MHSESPSDALTAVQLCARSRKAAALLLVVQERHQHRLHRCNTIRFLQAMESGCETQGAFEIISIERRRIAVRRERPLPQMWVCVGQLEDLTKSDTKCSHQNSTPTKTRRPQNSAGVFVRESQSEVISTGRRRIAVRREQAWIYVAPSLCGAL
jgi:hypothetical protein